MDNLLTQRHPDIEDIGEYQLNKTLKYTHLDESGNVIECLERSTCDDEFKDTTEIERERRNIIQYEKELNRMKRKVNENKETPEDYEEKNSSTDYNS